MQNLSIGLLASAVTVTPAGRAVCSVRLHEQVCAEWLIAPDDPKAEEHIAAVVGGMDDTERRALGKSISDQFTEDALRVLTAIEETAHELDIAVQVDPTTVALVAASWSRSEEWTVLAPREDS